MSNSDNINQQIQELLRKLIKNNDAFLDKLRIMAEEQRNAEKVSDLELNQSVIDTTSEEDSCAPSSELYLSQDDVENEILVANENGFGDRFREEQEENDSSLTERKEVKESNPELNHSSIALKQGDFIPYVDFNEQPILNAP